MSRSDVEEIIEIIKKEAQAIDSKSFVTPVGGYRYSDYNTVMSQSGLTDNN
jgi:hypothetical protein